MVKRNLTVIAIVIFLTSVANAVDLCTMPAFMDVGTKVKKCYFGCVDFEVRADFQVRLGWKYVVGNVLINTNWDVFFEGENTIPGDGEFHERRLCFMVSKVKTAKKVKLQPGSKPLISTVIITYDPPEGDYFIEFKDCFYKKIEIVQNDCNDLDLITNNTTNDTYNVDFNDLFILAEKWLEI